MSCNFYILRKLLLILLLLPSLSIAVSIKEYQDKNPNWYKSVEEAIYITNRCSGIIQVVGQHQLVSGDAEIGEMYLFLGQELARRSWLRAINEGISLDKVKDITRYWMKTYAEIANANTDNYNNIFVNDFADDYEFCDSLVERMIERDTNKTP